MRNATFERQGWSYDSTSLPVLSLLVVLAGLWQIVAPFLLNFADDQIVMRNSIASGIALALFAGLGAYGRGRWRRSAISAWNWLACLTALWLLISPFILDYREPEPAFWSAVVVGLLSVIIAGVAAFKYGGRDAPGMSEAYR